MDNHRDKIIKLFGEMHYSSDEETIQFNQRVKDAFGSDSEEEVFSDTIELSCSDIEEEKVIDQPLYRISAVVREEDIIQRAKELAQYQRRSAARMTKYQYTTPSYIPPSVIITDSQGIPEVTPEEAQIRDEEEIIQEAETTVRGRTVIEVIQDIMHAKGNKEDEIKEIPLEISSIIKPLPVMTIPTLNTVPTITAVDKPQSWAERRRAAKRKWFKKTKITPNTPK